MSTPEASFEPGRLLRALADHGVEFVVIGGMAVIAHGVVRATADVDVIPAPTDHNYRRLQDAIEALRGRLAGVDASLLGVPLTAEEFAKGASFPLETRFGALELLQGLPGMPPYAELRHRAIAAELEGVRVLVCSRQDLETMKRAADRAQDRADLAALRELDELEG